MKFFIVILILLIILFIPIPIKLKIHFSKETYYVKLYRLTLLSKDGSLINKFLKKTDSKLTSNDIKNIKYKNNKDNLFNKFRLAKFKKLYVNFQKNIFKPSLKFSLEGYYSLNDAALNSIIYGLISNFNFIFHKFFSDFCKLKKFNFSLTPKYNDDLLYNFSINSIITFNFAQIIYILFLIKKSLKEVPL